MTPLQQDEVRRRLAAGESPSALAAEFKVGRATIQRLSAVSGNVRKVAETLVAAQAALASLPRNQQHMAVNLAEKLRSISENLASAAELSAKTSHRLHALANTVMQKVDDADPMNSREELQGVAVLTKMANEAAITPMGLLSANKPAIERLNAPDPEKPSIDPTKLSAGTLEELLAARDAAAR